ncbi:PREDICTED: uncharacterized protein LOC105558179 [Vollenhovia emeryi]|uniref:uncharacterized protein LOC105558179 n=1 Tax=Vollenhovia emeryi TaxID=411798 RepID=UPI0005F57749|nr:PREDICTED: uncharacterized protein LOC105558179 [Vollenhovia emeryi]
MERSWPRSTMLFYRILRKNRHIKRGDSRKGGPNEAAECWINSIYWFITMSIKTGSHPTPARGRQKILKRNNKCTNIITCLFCILSGDLLDKFRVGTSRLIVSITEYLATHN